MESITVNMYARNRIFAIVLVAYLKQYSAVRRKGRSVWVQSHLRCSVCSTKTSSHQEHKNTTLKIGTLAVCLYHLWKIHGRKHKLFFSFSVDTDHQISHTHRQNFNPVIKGMPHPVLYNISILSSYCTLFS